MKTRHVLSALLAVGVAAPAVADARIPSDLAKELRGYIENMQESKDPHAKQASLMTLGRIADREDRKTIEGFKSDASQRVKYGAGFGLMFAGDRGGDDFVEKQINEDSSLYLSLREVVTVLPDDQEIDVLEDALADADDTTRRDIFRYLAQQHGDLYELLGEKLTSRDDATRKAAVQAIAFTGRDEAISYAEKMIDSRRDAIQADGVELAILLTRRPGGAPKVVPILLSAMKDVDGDAANSAMRRLVELGNEEAAARMARSIADKEEVTEKKDIAGFLLEHEASVPVDTIKPHIEKAEDQAYKVMLWQLVAASGGADFEELQTKFQSTEFSDRIIAVKAMGHTGNDKAIQPLSQAMFEGDPELRAAAAEAFGELGIEEGLDALRRALNRERVKTVKLEVIDAISKIDSARSVKMLRFQTTDRDPEIKKRVIEALRTLGRTEGAKALGVLLRDRDMSIQWAAFVAALELDPDEAFARMGSALRNPPSNFMSDVESLRSETRRRLIRFMLEKGTDQVRGPALTAVQKMGDARFEIARELVMDDSVDEGVRRTLLVELSEKKDPKDKSLFERVVRESSSKPLTRVAAWTLTEYATDDLEATFRGYLGNSDEGIKAIGAYGLATVKD
ncbi:MAG: HEAT repeat domain-containing protein [Myxococcota bacterium]